MALPDPVDVRLLHTVAETGRAAVHEIAGRLGMDVRDVAARLAALSTTGLPIVVGVECDPHGIRTALASAGVWGQQPGNPPAPPAPAHSAAGQPGFPQPSLAGPPAGMAGQPGSGPPPPPPNSGSGSGPQHGTPAERANPWGPPGSASWARGDGENIQAPPHQQLVSHIPPRSGQIGSKLDLEGLEGEQLTIQLVEVVDPADFLFTAAGYRLREGERAVVVHTELINRGSVPFTALPDMYLFLVAVDGTTLPKSTVTLSSRPPHQAGVSPGHTAGGHTVYVLPDSTELSAIRWTLRPGDGRRTLTWHLT